MVWRGAWHGLCIKRRGVTGSVRLILPLACFMLIRLCYQSSVSPETTTGAEQLPALNNLTIRLLTSCPDLCAAAGVKIIIFVLSRPHAANTRNVIRNTYGDPEVSPSVRVVFVIGQSIDEEINREVLKENTVHADLLVGDYLDTYYNCTHKVYTALFWIDHYCNQSTYTVKTDEDVMVNTFNLLAYMDNRAEVLHKNKFGNLNSSKVNGSFFCRTNRGKVVRDPSSKWYISYKDYPARWYPVPCEGGAYMFDTALTSILWRGSASAKYVPFEDVFFPGVVRDKFHIEISHEPGIFGDVIESNSIFLHSRNMNTDTFWSLWTKLLDINSNRRHLDYFH